MGNSSTKWKVATPSPSTPGAMAAWWGVEGGGESRGGIPPPGSASHEDLPRPTLSPGPCPAARPLKNSATWRSVPCQPPKTWWDSSEFVVGQLSRAAVSMIARCPLGNAVSLRGRVGGGRTLRDCTKKRIVRWRGGEEGMLWGGSGDRKGLEVAGQKSSPPSPLEGRGAAGGGAKI